VQFFDFRGEMLPAPQVQMAAGEDNSGGIGNDRQFYKVAIAIVVSH